MIGMHFLLRSQLSCSLARAEGNPLAVVLVLDNILLCHLISSVSLPGNLQCSGHAAYLRGTLNITELQHTGRSCPGRTTRPHADAPYYVTLLSTLLRRLERHPMQCSWLVGKHHHNGDRQSCLRFLRRESHWGRFSVSDVLRRRAAEIRVAKEVL